MISIISIIALWIGYIVICLGILTVLFLIVAYLFYLILPKLKMFKYFAEYLYWRHTIRDFIAENGETLGAEKHIKNVYFKS